jgi:hypothetical protein
MAIEFVLKIFYYIKCLIAILGISVRTSALLLVALISLVGFEVKAATVACFSTAANERMETTKTVNQYEIWQITPDNGAGLFCCHSPPPKGLSRSIACCDLKPPHFLKEACQGSFTWQDELNDSNTRAQWPLHPTCQMHISHMDILCKRC